MEKELWNYEQEVKKIEQRPVIEKFKPDKEGFYKIKILTEPERTFYTDETTPEKTTEQIILRILESGKEKVWYIPVGLTPKSAYYKLMYIGKYYGGLMGIELRANLSMQKNKEGRLARNWDFMNYLELKEKENVQ
jgi:hypothetical protein